MRLIRILSITTSIIRIPLCICSGWSLAETGEEYDVSRTAARLPGVREVLLVCLESLEEMPADTVEILEGAEEGILRHNSWGPKEILVREVDGQRFVRGARFIRCTSVYDENKRFAPRFDENVEMALEGDTVLLSVGQAAD
ncbi:MAG: hypothetical protein L0332_24215, partial [Chloroflexi bacterium]|nr:hypothetical protein [Chloroflexota bacterium]